MDRAFKKRVKARKYEIGTKLRNQIDIDRLAWCVRCKWKGDTYTLKAYRQLYRVNNILAITTSLTKYKTGKISHVYT